jgi:hypothetical protein
MTVRATSYRYLNVRNYGQVVPLGISRFSKIGISPNEVNPKLKPPKRCCDVGGINFWAKK